MTAAVVVYTRDLRLRDHEGLAEAARAHERLLPLFVLDERLLDRRAASRLSFLLASLADLRRSLRQRGSDLILRRGDPVVETVRLVREAGATRVYLGVDASGYAQVREFRLREALKHERIELRLVSTIAIAPPGSIVPEGSDHYRVFTPYWRRWQEAQLRALVPTPDRLPPVGPVERGVLPELRDLTPLSPARDLPAGGETAGLERLRAWLGDGLAHYDERRDQLEPGSTSRLSPYLHLGCLSAVEAARRARQQGGSGAVAFLRQLCWRDFFLQLLAASPRLAREDLRRRVQPERDDPDALAAWRQGCTGYPIVDAAMRQLAAEAWIPNRARLIAAAFLTRRLGLDWRLGAHVFSELLVDGDVASNAGNWQWVAGTGANPRPRITLSLLRQARRFDPEGAYVRRYLPELEALEGASVHEPWRARPGLCPGYPKPIVDPESPILQRRLRA